MVDRGSGRTEQLAQEEKSKLINVETKWGEAATERLLDLLEARKRLISDAGRESVESPHKLRYQDWRPMATKLQSEGFMYTTASCQKKYINMKRTYLNTKKIIEKQRLSAKLGDSSTKSIRIGWPPFERFATFMDEPVDADIVLKPRGDKGDDEEDEENYEDDDESRSSKNNSRRDVSSKYKAQVSSAVQTLLKSEPVVILEDCVANEMDYSLQLVSDEVSRDIIKEEIVDDDSEAGNHHQNQSLLRKLRRRTRESPESDASYEPSTKRGRKPRVRYSPTSSPEPVRRKSETNSVKPVKTFSLNSTTSDEVVAELKRLRGDVNKINRNLEDLVTSHNQLSSNFEKFFKLMSKRYK